jgi:ADP-ribose pyrophosphatase YjhB (NUDIX family)
VSTEQTSPHTGQQPAIQLIADVVALNDAGQVLLARYGDADDTSPRWWLPAGELEPYEHPDDVARTALGELGVSVESLTLHRIRSFRGRRGWHVMFDYRAEVGGDPRGDIPAAWHDPADLPPTAHGSHERETIGDVLTG